IRHDHDPHPELVAEAHERAGGPRDQLDLVGVGDVIPFDVDRAVAVDQREAACHADGAPTREPRRARTPVGENATGGNRRPGAVRAGGACRGAAGGAAIKGLPPPPAPKFFPPGPPAAPAAASMRSIGVSSVMNGFISFLAWKASVRSGPMLAT